MPTVTRIGPFSGIDNVHQPDARTFQPPGELEKRLQALVAATGVDLDDDGWPEASPPVENVVSLTNGLGGFSALGLMLVQEGGTISKVVAGVKTPIIAGLSTSLPVTFHEWAGQIWWTNSIHCGRISSAGVAANWGLAVPPAPTLGTTAGSMPAGRYQVAATYVDAAGIEGGASPAGVITLDGTQAITATFAVAESKAATIRYYISKIDGKGQSGLFFAKAVAVAGVSTTITTATGSLELCKTQFLQGPPPGAGVASYKDVLMTWSGEWLYLSSGRSPHLFDTNNSVIKVRGTIRGVVGLDTGIWIATDVGMRWVAGDALATMRVVEKDAECYAWGSHIVDGWVLPRLQTSSKVALFVSQYGLVAGLPSGEIVPFTRGTYSVGAIGSRRASFAVVNRAQFKQVLFALN